MRMKKIYICGLAGSGKGLLKQLLDGHSRLCIIPFQGFILKRLGEYDFKSIETNPKFLSPYRGSYYENLPFFTVKDSGKSYRIDFDEFIRNIYYCYDLYAAYRSKRIWGGATAVTAAGIDVSVDFIFDYFSYEQEWFERLFVKQADVSIEEFLDIMYSCFVNNWKNSYARRDSEYAIVTPVQNGINPIRWLLKNTKNTKTLLMERDCVGFSYAYAKQKSLHLKKPLSSQLYNLSLIHAFKEYREFIHGPAIKGDPRVLIVDFEELVLNTRKTMIEAADFLNIDFEDILTKATLNRVPLESNGKQFTGVIHDNPIEVLPPDGINFLRYLYGIDGGNRGKMKSLWYGIRAFDLSVLYNVRKFWQEYQRLMEVIKTRLIRQH
jgi:hypothetical protein